MNPIERNSLLEVSVAMEEVEYLFSSSVQYSARWALPLQSYLWRPPTDLYETEDHFIVQVEIAGMCQSDFHVILNERQISISGQRQSSGQRRAYHQMEIHFGQFRTDLELPAPAVLQGIEASYRDGFLLVVLPKLKADPATR